MKPEPGGDDAHELYIPTTGKPSPRLTHYLFRYPAKFHPPVVRALLDRYSDVGDTVLDPFVGSGTLLVEAAVTGRHGIGTDVDPVAVAVARAKVHRYNASALSASCDAVVSKANTFARADTDYQALMKKDLSQPRYEWELLGVVDWVPAIPNLLHWFRRYVVIDLAFIRAVVETAAIPETHRDLLRVVFASIIRNASNADPVPVSGLEVTAHMKRRDEAGRLINPFELFASAVKKAVTAMKEFSEGAHVGSRQQVRLANATKVARHVHQPIDAVITSPPYHGAVDYYRRHQLEMFWLGHTESQTDRLALLPNYIGRPKVAQRDPLLQAESLDTTLAVRWEERIREVSTQRADAFRHYLIAMGRVFDQLSQVLKPGHPAIIVVGNSTWNGGRIPTSDLFQEIAREAFELREVLSYPVKNRYMSYTRHNGADISREYVVVLSRTSSRRP